MKSIAQFRYWTRCLVGEYRELYRFRRSPLTFESLIDGQWIEQVDRYKRVMWDNDYDEIDPDLAQRIEHALLLNQSIKCQESANQATAIFREMSV